MKLADLLADVASEDLARLAREHAHTDETLGGPQLRATIEGVLRSHRFLQEFLLNRQPPTFAIITILLDASGHSIPAIELRDAVLAETDRLCVAIDSGELLERDEQLRIYRRVLYQARSNDLQLDASEASILGVLRQELEIAQVEHFLIEHHADLREFWRGDGAFERELLSLRSAGLVYERAGSTLMPEDLAQGIRQVVGIDMSRTNARRLYGYLSNNELYECLSAVRVPTSGTKEDRLERLISNNVQPRSALHLRTMGVDRLREICKEIGATVSGSKDELARRIIAHVAAGRDLLGEPEPPPPVQEPRRLDGERFALLFSRLRGHELAAILSELELRRWGSKETQVQTLWEAHRAEQTLLATLSSSDIEGLLRRVALRTGGSKTERIERAIEHFAVTSLDQLRSAYAQTADATPL